MATKPFIVVEYKYPERHWVEYDRTQVSAWATTQFERMKEEHPAAEHRKVPKA